MKIQNNTKNNVKPLPSKQPTKTHADRIREAKEREVESNQAAIRLAKALGLPVAHDQR